MKSIFLNIAASIVFLFDFRISLSAQTTATWQGGKPGRSTDWNCPANWREGKTPDEFTQVIIPAGTEYYPILKNEATPIDALLMEGGTELTLQNGSMLTVLGETGRFDSIIVFGKIINNGTLVIEKMSSINMAFLQQIQGVGSVVNSLASIDSLATGQ